MWPGAGCPVMLALRAAAIWRACIARCCCGRLPMHACSARCWCCRLPAALHRLHCTLLLLPAALQPCTARCYCCRLRSGRHNGTALYCCCLLSMHVCMARCCCCLVCCCCLIMHMTLYAGAAAGYASLQYAPLLQPAAHRHAPPQCALLLLLPAAHAFLLLQSYSCASICMCVSVVCAWLCVTSV